MECRMNEINRLIALALAEGGRKVGDQMLKINAVMEFAIHPR